MYGVRRLDRRTINRPWREETERLLLRLFGVFALGCVLGSLAGLAWPAGLLRSRSWTLRLMGETVPYGRLLLQTLRIPVFLCLCASAGRHRSLAWPALCLQGLILAYAASCLLQAQGAVGLLMAVAGLFCSGFLPLPLLFYLALRCCSLRRPLPMDGSVLRLLIGILLFCAICAALDHWISPFCFSFLLWISG